MDNSQMRAALEKKYGKPFVAGKRDDQIQAIYLRLKAQNKL